MLILFSFLLCLHELKKNKKEQNMFLWRCIIIKWNTIYDESSMMIDWLIDLLRLNATFSNISAKSWRPVLVVEEAGVPGEKHRPWARNR